MINVLSPTLLWAIAGAILCLMELFIPTAFIEFTMGISALLVAVISLFVPSFSLQMAIWLVLSVLLVIASRRFFSPKRSFATLGDDTEGRTLTAIEPGETGRVLYEGNSWAARCSDETESLDPQEKVYIVGRQGNTLIVVPQKLLNS
ncbi:MAG: NfeD family protein [Jaaginema sp. PMC 1079.18]|nr:NfeD family protein [Jaaginema sp. PMC 1080.18]MEC4849718.1 NfeD family protein [Jaaginema sp. PMC 1079.18]MEC4864853.1 NfeD family protein [Jaaginema sp. PMC 1078.18]